jgi:putative exporter of polyketide antibiotics
MNLAVDITSWIWLALEVGLRVRDRIAHRGSTGRDGATRRTIMVMIVPAVLAATALGYLLLPASPLLLPGARQVPWPEVAGLAVMWLALAVRVWAIAVLGRRFRRPEHEGRFRLIELTRDGRQLRLGQAVGVGNQRQRVAGQRAAGEDVHEVEGHRGSQVLQPPLIPNRTC